MPLFPLDLRWGQGGENFALRAEILALDEGRDQAGLWCPGISAAWQVRTSNTELHDQQQSSSHNSLRQRASLALGAWEMDSSLISHKKVTLEMSLVSPLISRLHLLCSLGCWALPSGARLTISQSKRNESHPNTLLKQIQGASCLIIISPEN